MKTIDSKHIYSRKDVNDLGFKRSEYKFMDKAGVLFGILDLRTLGKGNNILLYFTLSDGKKVVASVYANDGYYRGFKSIDNGSYCKLYVKYNKNNNPIITRADVLDKGGGKFGKD